jgi:O-antigen/teichoic acid export membrane protein
VTALLMPFSGLGFANVMVMRSTRDPSLLPLYLGNALAMMIVSGSLLILGAIGWAQLWLSAEVPLLLMLLVAISELILSKTVDICWHTFIAREQLHFTSQIMGTQSASRLLFACSYVWLGNAPNALGWAYWSLLSNALVSIAVLLWTTRTIGRLRFDATLARGELGSGASFAIGISAKGFYTEADKMFLARYGGTEAVGHYTVAFRVIQIALAPIRALCLALQARLFRAGQAGIHGSLGVTLRVLGPLSLAAAVLGIGYYVCAPMLTWVAGDKYAGSVEVLRVLCMLPLLLAAQALLADTLASSGYQRLAALFEVVAAILICVLCSVLVPSHGWRGAALASYVSQGALVLLLGISIRKLMARSAPPSEIATVRSD